MIFARYGQAGHRQAAPGAGQAARCCSLAAPQRGRPDRGGGGLLPGRRRPDRPGGLRRLPRPGRDGRVRRLVRRISPLGEIGGLRIGSRPGQAGLSAGRRCMDLDDLRAIPWVFAWSQTRMNLPGWFGLGSGLAADRADPDGAGLTARSAAGGAAAGVPEWPLFGVLLDNAEMSLAKTDRPDRGPLSRPRRPGRPDRAGTGRVRPDPAAGAGRHRPRPAAGRPAGAVPGCGAARSVRGRAVLPAAPGPVRAARASATNRGSGALERLLLLTVNGVAAGLQNTG